MATVELTVPDIGDFTDVPIIEIFVKPGDTVVKDAPLLTMESDKATLDVPASHSGTIRDVKVKIGDRISQGSVIATVEAEAAAASGAETPKAPETPAAPDKPDIAQASEATPTGRGTSGEGLQELIVPDIGDFREVPIIEVFAKVGETIAKDAPLITMESDKATLDVPASHGGVVRELRVKIGDRISQGSVLAIVATGVPAPEGTTAAAGGDGASLGRAATNPAGYGSNPSTQAASVAISAGANGSHGNGKTGGAVAAETVDAGLAHASPSIRRFARELGVAVGSVAGTGPNGRITREDVQSYVKQALVGVATAAPAAAPAAGGSGFGFSLPAWPKTDFAAFGPVERVPLARIKRLSGPYLHRNWVSIPHVTQHEEADVTELEAFRKQLNGEQKDAKVTMLAFLIKAAVAALRRFPDFNSSLEGDELIRKGYYHVGFAADTPQGLVVPVIRDADGKGVLDIARETAELAKKARDGKLTNAEMSGGTFTISSLGGIGGTYFTPIINAPEVAILGVCRADVKPVWDGAAFAPRLLLPLSLSYDHRVVDGASAARFSTTLALTLRDLRRVLL